MSNGPTAIVATIGIDIGKYSFHIVGLDRRGAIVCARSGCTAKLKRGMNIRPA
jgi:hypothetical protein